MYDIGGEGLLRFCAEYKTMTRRKANLGKGQRRCTKGSPEVTNVGGKRKQNFWRFGLLSSRCHRIAFKKLSVKLNSIIRALRRSEFKIKLTEQIFLGGGGADIVKKSNLGWLPGFQMRRRRGQKVAKPTTSTISGEGLAS